MPEISTPEQVEIKKIAIRSEKFLDGKELLLAGIDNDAPVALALEIFENIYYPYLTGNLYLVDDNDIARIIRMNGTERLVVELKSPEAESFIEKTFIISSTTKTIKISDTISHLVLELTEDHGYFNELEIINKSYTGTGPGIISKILEDNTTKKLLIGQAQNYNLPKFRYIVPNLSSYEAIKTVVDHMTTSGGLPYFFYSSLVTNDLILTDLETVMRQGPFNEEIGPFTYSRAIQAQNTDIIGQALSISNLSSDHTNDTLSMAKRGALGSRINLTNSNTGSTRPFKLNMKQQFEQILNDNIDIFQGMDIPIDTLFRIDNRLSENFGDLNSKVFSPLASNSYQDTNSLISNNETMVQLIVKNNLLKHLGNNSFIITVPGLLFGVNNRDRAVGREIKIKVFRDGDQQSNFYQEDEKRSGNFLMMSKRHIFNIKSNVHNINIRVGRIAMPKRID